MKHLALLISLALFSNIASAQNHFELGLTGIPTYSNFHAGGQSDHYNFIRTFNYGLKLNWRKNNFQFSTGILHLTQGTKMEVLLTSSDNPQGTGGYFDLYLRTKTIAVPLNVDYIFASAGRTKFFGGLGIYAGYIYSQQQEDTSVPEDYEPDPLSGAPRQRFTDFDGFEDLYLGANIGVGIIQSLNEYLSLQFRPNFLYQLRKEKPAETHSFTIRHMSIGADVGLYYRF